MSQQVYRVHKTENYWERKYWENILAENIFANDVSVIEEYYLDYSFFIREGVDSHSKMRIFVQLTEDIWTLDCGIGVGVQFSHALGGWH